MQLGDQIYYIDIEKEGDWQGSRFKRLTVRWATLVSVDNDSSGVVVELPCLFTRLKTIDKRLVFATREELDGAIYQMFNSRIKT